MMRIETTFFLDTSREIFDSWLVRTWTTNSTNPTPHGGMHYLGPARRNRDKVTIDGGYVTKPNAEDVSTMYPFGWVIAFEAIPLGAERIEVRGTCTSEIAETTYRELLTLIASRWPESGLALIDAEEVTPAVRRTRKTRPDTAERRRIVHELWIAKAPGTSKERFKEETANSLAVSPSTIRDDLIFLETNVDSTD